MPSVCGKTANNAASCSRKKLAIEGKDFDKMITALKAEGGYLCSTEEREILRKTMWPDGHTLNREIVAKSATFIAELAGLKVPKNTTMLMVMGEKIGKEDRFSGEKLSPVLTVWKWNDFDEMLDRMEKILKFSGEGHSVNIQTRLDERMHKIGLRANVGRVVANEAIRRPTAELDESPGLYGHWAADLGRTSVVKISSLHTRVAVLLRITSPTDEELFGAY